ncbi:MAG: glycosyltransferase [Lachnospiraceae bacterium]|nr:glycosyltransferase [Lachnospiraceae bacterium]
MNKKPIIDVIIPVYKPDNKLTALLDRLKRQSVRPEKIIIMYTKESESDLCPLKDPGLEIHELSKDDFDHGGTRNEGAGFSNAEYMLFMTQDAVPSDNLLVEKLLEGFKSDKTAVCYARQLPRENASLSERFSREFNYPPVSLTKNGKDLKTLGIKAFFCSNVCAMYDREIFNRLGGFTDRTVFNEDMIYARKALDSGYDIVYKADASVIHSHDLTNMDQFRRNMLIARSQKAYPEVFGDVSSESEGIRYVREAYSYFRQNKKGYYIIPFIITCGFRFAGFRLGKL